MFHTRVDSGKKLKGEEKRKREIFSRGVDWRYEDLWINVWSPCGKYRPRLRNQTLLPRGDRTPYSKSKLTDSLRYWGMKNKFEWCFPWKEYHCRDIQWSNSPMTGGPYAIKLNGQVQAARQTICFWDQYIIPQRCKPSALLTDFHCHHPFRCQFPS